MVALVTLSSKSLSIRGLEVFSSRRLNADHGIVRSARCMRWTETAIETVLRLVGAASVILGDDLIET